jgi:muramoyltetrapeptide carboxypeptidase
LSVRWPPPVRPGDRVGVAALSGPVAPEALDRGLDALRSLGFEPVPAANAGSKWGPFAGRDEERLAGFHELLDDESLSAIFFARGGHGLLRVIDRLDWARIAARPRAWVGYSDLTPLLLRIVERCGLVTFHGPMVGTDLARGLTAEESESLIAALGGERPSLPVRSLRDGGAEGPVMGGCLSLLTAVLGTPWAPDLRDSILFVEDINEPAYKVDRMLTHLRLSGTLAGVRAIVAGHFGADWERGLAGPGAGATTEPAGPWQLESLLELPGPLACGLPVGHGVPNLTLPLGAAARLDPDRGALVYL